MDIDKKNKKIIIIPIIIVLILIISACYMIFQKEYTIKVMLKNDTYALKVKRNKKIIISNLKKKDIDGYTFVGWYVNGKPYDFDTRVNKNFTIKAKYIKVKNNDDREEEKENSIITTTKINTTTSSTTTNITTSKHTAKKIVSTKANTTSVNTTKKPQSTTVKTTTTTKQQSTTAKTTTTTKQQTTTAKTTTTTKQAINYSYEWIKIEESTIGQYKLYLLNENGNRISGTATITYLNGKSENLSIPLSGKIFIKSTIKSITNIKG